MGYLDDDRLPPDREIGLPHSPTHAGMRPERNIYCHDGRAPTRRFNDFARKPVALHPHWLPDLGLGKRSRRVREFIQLHEEPDPRCREVLPRFAIKCWQSIRTTAVVVLGK